MLIGARTTMMNAGPSARDYVQDGLIAMWDGIENAGWGTHDDTATTWKDLSGNGYDLEATFASWGPDSFKFYRNSYQALSCSASNLLDKITIEAVLRNVSPNNRIALIFGNGNYGVVQISHNADAAEFGFGYNKGSVKVSGASFSVSAVFPSNTTPTRYLNGSLGEDGSYSSSFGTTGIRGVFAMNPRSDYQFGGEICAIRLYDDMLTAYEIAANYAVDKARFNLPQAS